MMFGSFCRCQPVQIPHFIEADHQLIRALQSASDAELIQGCCQEMDQAKFFVAFFCRYSSVTYSIFQHVASSPVQAEYTFAKAWQHMFERIQQLDEHHINNIVWQNWVVDVAGNFLDNFQPPPIETIHYRLATGSPPLLCYVQRSLNLMQPLLRLLFMMNNHWHWPAERIIGHLRAEGEQVEDIDLLLYLSESRKDFEKTLPIDLHEIYGQSAALDFDINTSGEVIDRGSLQR